jgi:uncharacterized repeat protein (TIGR01451 family)
VPSSTPTNTGPPSSTPTNTGVPSSTPTNATALTATPTATQTPTQTLEIVEETATPQVAVDLAIEKRFADATCGRGQAGRYILTVRNLGGSTPSAPMVTDTLPPGVTMTSTSGTGWDCSASTPTVVQCTATSAFGPGESRSIDINVAIALTADPALVNTASVSGQIGELELTNNTVTIVTLCLGGPTGAPAMGPIGFAIAIALLGAIAYWRLRGVLDE